MEVLEVHHTQAESLSELWVHNLKILFAWPNMALKALSANFVITFEIKFKIVIPAKMIIMIIRINNNPWVQNLITHCNVICVGWVCLCIILEQVAYRDTMSEP